MYRILCVEDDAETRILVKKSLEHAGMVVDTVWGGEKGVEAALSGHFDCVVLDIMMPGMDGFQVLHALRSHGLTADLPVVVVTGRDDREARTRADAAGANAFLSKPFELKTLVGTIEQVIEARQRAG